MLNFLFQPQEVVILARIPRTEAATERDENRNGFKLVAAAYFKYVRKKERKKSQQRRRHARKSSPETREAAALLLPWQRAAAG